MLEPGSGPGRLVRDDVAWADGTRGFAQLRDTERGDTCTMRSPNDPMGPAVCVPTPRAYALGGSDCTGRWARAWPGGCALSSDDVVVSTDCDSISVERVDDVVLDNERVTRSGCSLRRADETVYSLVPAPDACSHGCKRSFAAKGACGGRCGSTKTAASGRRLGATTTPSSASAAQPRPGPTSGVSLAERVSSGATIACSQTSDAPSPQGGSLRSRAIPPSTSGGRHARARPVRGARPRAIHPTSIGGASLWTGRSTCATRRRARARLVPWRRARTRSASRGRIWMSSRGCGACWSERGARAQPRWRA